MPKNILRYASDIHLELRKKISHPKLQLYWNFDIDPDNKYYLALLGDIGNPFHPNLNLFLSKVSRFYEKIFYVPGNHEYYNLNIKNKKSYLEFDSKLREICQSYDNIILLNEGFYQLDKIKIIGCTLWSNIDNDHKQIIEESLNDYHLILDENLKPITTDHTNQWNYNAIKYIQEQTENSQDACIILTHFAPLFSNSELNQFTVKPCYLNSNLSQAFCNDLSFLLKKPIMAWLYGHTHYTSNFEFNNIVIASNQLGYQNEDSEKGFQPVKAYLDLDKFQNN